MKPDVRDRLVLPLLIPLGIVGFIALVAGIFGMVLLFNPLQVSLVIAIVVAGGLLAAFGIASSQRAEEINRAKRAVIASMVIAPLLVGGLVAVDVIPTTSEKVAHEECEFCVPEDAVTVVANGIRFQQDEIQLPGSGEASILFENEDLGIPHNIAIAPLGPDGQPLWDEPIFDGE
ncbi:MAG: hypothetical protein ACRDUY_01820, partial [Nitriliruptorales bacterium]